MINSPWIGSVLNVLLAVRFFFSMRGRKKIERGVLVFTYLSLFVRLVFFISSCLSISLSVSLLFVKEETVLSAHICNHFLQFLRGSCGFCSEEK